MKYYEVIGGIYKQIREKTLYQGTEKRMTFPCYIMPVIIEFSRCIGTYSSAKFEL